MPPLHRILLFWLLGCVVIACCDEKPYWVIRSFDYKLSSGYYPGENSRVTDTLYADSLIIRAVFGIEFTTYNTAHAQNFGFFAFSCPDDGYSGPKTKFTDMKILCNRPIDNRVADTDLHDLFDWFYINRRDYSIPMSGKEEFLKTFNDSYYGAYANPRVDVKLRMKIKPAPGTYGFSIELTDEQGEVTTYRLRPIYWP